MKKWLFILSVAICALPAIMPAQADTGQRDPWTQQARTFNPAGVRYAGGVTTGREISDKAVTVKLTAADLLRSLDQE